MRTVLAGMEAQSVHCCITSPPYWGLRDYKLPPVVWGGVKDCDHLWVGSVRKGQSGGMASKMVQIKGEGNFQIVPDAQPAGCSECGAWRGCLGLEPTPELYVAHIVECFRAVRRVLRDDGTLWLNMGDAYCSTGGQRTEGSHDNGTGRADAPGPRLSNASRPGNLLGMPWKVAFALQADGWILRSAIVWAKGESFNPDRAGSVMPESVAGWRWERHRIKMRSADPHGNHKLIEVVGQDGRNVSLNDARDNPQFLAQWQDCPGCPKCEANPAACPMCSDGEVSILADWLAAHGPDLPAIPGEESYREVLGQCPMCHGTGRYGGYVLRRGSWRPTSAYEMVFMFAKTGRYYADGEAVKEPALYAGRRIALGPKSLSMGQATGRGVAPTGNALCDSVVVTPDRNLRNVWQINTQAYRGAHFATFAEALVEPCIKAGTSPKCCGICGAPWARVVAIDSTLPTFNEWRKQRGITQSKADFDPRQSPGAGQGYGGSMSAYYREVHGGASRATYTVTWRSTCVHDDETGRALVLDPFAGTGTVGVVCQRLGRHFVGIELSEAYVKMAEARLREPQTVEMLG
jgi:DNA modification methylase